MGSEMCIRDSYRRESRHPGASLRCPKCKPPSRNDDTGPCWLAAQPEPVQLRQTEIRLINRAVKLSAALLAIALSAPIGLINPAAAEELTKTELSPAQATKAANRLLRALEERIGIAVYEALAAPIQASVDLQSVQTRLNKCAAIDASHIFSVIPGYTTTTIEAVVTTASGDEEMLLVLDEDGKLLA